MRMYTEILKHLLFLSVKKKNTYVYRIYYYILEICYWQYNINAWPKTIVSYLQIDNFAKFYKIYNESRTRLKFTSGRHC